MGNSASTSDGTASKDGQTNRIYKNSVFVDLFSCDITARENFLSLYNALHGTHLSLEETSVDIRTLERTLYMGFKNDVSAIINGKLIVLVEHQSTINENMPLRFLEYAAEFYKQLVPTEKRYLRRLVKIPRPEFYVLYNGEAEYPIEKTLKLSDAFLEAAVAQSDTPAIEIYAKVININTTKKNKILSRCEVLRGYSRLIELIRAEKASGNEKFYYEAIQKALRGNVLPEYLRRKQWEVANMTFAEYDYDMDIAVQREEAREEGIAIGEERGAHNAHIETARALMQDGIPVDLIAKYTGLSPEDISNL